MARSKSSGRPWLWPASRKFAPSLLWTSRTPPNAWLPASFRSLKLCEFIPISAASALNPASVNSSSVALRIPSSIASAPTASSSPPSPTPPNLDKLPCPHAPSADAGDELLDEHLFIEDADALYAEYAAQGVEFARGLRHMPWHKREFVSR